ncbi:MAG: hypothetical protein CMJ50_08965 [Planctomycetaceae bacterium]|nr:hypothetical protein [Planctomycetaceae bacterium]
MRSLRGPAALAEILSGKYPKTLNRLVYDLGSDNAQDLPWALDVLETAATPAPAELIPVMPVDERSFACVVCKEPSGPQPLDFGRVVRWHLDDVPEWAQRQVLDVSVKEYLATMAADLAAKDAGLKLIKRIIATYHGSHGASGTRPRHYHERPIRVAVQNVIIGHAAIRHDDMFNGLSAKVWQSCQVPHVAVHEGSRALAALTLGEAFRSGGTMEVRFDRHPEKKVPAVLRQFARTRGIELGTHDPRAIHPAEARELMWAATEMPDDLRNRLEKLTTSGRLTPERACFVLLSGIWLPIELDFLAATSGRLVSILRGDCDPRIRAARQAELGVSRAAHMLGVLFKVLTAPEGGGSIGETVPVHEDRQSRVTWEILPDIGAVRMRGENMSHFPWTERQTDSTVIGNELLVFPRHTLTDRDVAVASASLRENGGNVGFLVPNEEAVTVPRKIAVMTCPDTLEAIDRAIERRLLASRVGRA